VDNLGVKQEESSEEDGEDTPETLATLAAIREMCADYNRKGALDLIAGIKSCARETRQMLDKAKDHIINSEFEEAEDVLEAHSAEKE